MASAIAAGLASDGVTEKLHVDLSGAPQTMLATFYAKAVDANLEKPILGDRFAEEIVDRIDYDWRKTSITATNSAAVTTRSAHFDNWARQFLAAHPEAVVLHLGCGLDARAFRLDPGPSAVRRPLGERPGTGGPSYRSARCGWSPPLSCWP